MSTADGFPWGATGNQQSAPLRVLFGRDLTFIQNTKCAKLSNNLNLVKSMQTTRWASHKLGGSAGTMAMMFRYTHTETTRFQNAFQRRCFQSDENFRLILLRSPLKASWMYYQGSFCFIVNTFDRLRSAQPCLLSVETPYQKKPDHLTLLASSITHSSITYHVQPKYLHFLSPLTYTGLWDTGAYPS